MHKPFDLAISLKEIILQICSNTYKEMNPQETFYVVLFIVAKQTIQSKCPPLDLCLIKLNSVTYNGIVVIIKKNEVALLVLI